MASERFVTATMMSAMRSVQPDLAAATLGWNMALLDGVDQNSIAMLLGTHRSDDFRDVEPEHPDCLAVIWPDGKCYVATRKTCRCFWIRRWSRTWLGDHGTGRPTS